MLRWILSRGWVWLGVTALLLLAAACAPGAQAPGAPQPPAAKAPAAAPAGAKYGGVFRMPTPDPPENLDPIASVGRSTQITIWGTVYDPLINLDFSVPDWRVDMPVVPWLAESWKLEGDRTYIFTLRKGVKWHDGVDLTLEDILWSFQYMMDPKNAFQAASVLRGIDKIEKVDDWTFKITLKGVNPGFLADLAGTVTNAVVFLPKHVYDKGGRKALESEGIGSGPFKVKKFDPTGTTVLVRNENYWSKDAQGKQQPYLDGVEFIHSMDRSAQEAAMAAGELDAYQFGTKPPYDAFVKVYKDVDTTIFWSNHSPSLYFNMTRKPFDDVRVRRAVHLAIDRTEMNETIALGQGKIALPVVPAIKTGWGISEQEMLQLPGYRQPKDQDLAEAKRLLAEAGFPTGLKMDHIYTKTWSTAVLAEFLPTQLKRVGIELALKGLDSGTYLAVEREGNFDTAWYLMGNHRPLLRLDERYHSESPRGKVAGFKDAEMDQLIEKLRVTFDINEQKRIVRRLQEITLEKAYVVPTLDLAIYLITQKWVQDYKPSYSIQGDLNAGANRVWFDIDKMPAKRRR